MPEGKKIREWRSERGISQSQLSDLVNIRQHKLSNWELGKESIPQSKLDTIRECIDDLTEEEIEDLNQRTILHDGNVSKSQSPKTKENSDEFSDSTNTINDTEIYPINWIAEELNQDERPQTNLNAIALFSGIGGLSLGFKLAGFNIVGYVEKEEPRREIYSANFEDAECLGHDIRDITKDQIQEWKTKFEDIDAVIGGPPCQGFSLAGKRDIKDDRNQLFKPYAMIISELNPDIFLMENVGKLTSMQAPDGNQIVSRIVDEFEDIGYDAEYEELNAKNYGVPQSRNRVIFIGIPEGDKNDIIFPDPTHANAESGIQTKLGDQLDDSLKDHETFRRATKDLCSLESGEESENDPWHFAVDHPEHVIKWLEDVPEGSSAHENDDPELRPNSGYNTTYKRIEWDEPCSTVTRTFGMISGTRNVHPEDTRSFTVREAMRCQTFPDDFEVFGNLTDVRDGIGNAVPPLFAKRLAEHLREKYLRPELEIA